MSDHDKLLEERVAGARASTILQDEQFINAVERLKAAYIEKLFATEVEDVRAREILYMAHRVLCEIPEQLQQVINDGKLANDKLNYMLRLAEQKKNAA
jgi:hypothetical protein